MNPIKYLSIENSPETNLKLIAQQKILVTKEVADQLPLVRNANAKARNILALTVATVAIGIIVGMTTSAVLGISIVVIAVIPATFWKKFKEQADDIQSAFDKETEKLEGIYNQMIESVQARHHFVHELLKESLKATFDIPSMAVLEQKCFGLEQKVFSELHDNQDKLLSEAEKEGEDYYTHALSIIKYKCDLSVPAAELRKDIETIASSKIQIPVLSNKWQSLQGMCQKYTRPYSSYFMLSKDEKKATYKKT